MGGAQPGPADRLGHQTGGIYLLVRFPHPLPGDEVRRGTCLSIIEPSSGSPVFNIKGMLPVALSTVNESYSLFLTQPPFLYAP